MAADEIHVGDVGLVFIITIKDGSTVVDLSSATTKQLLFQKPDQTVLTKTASFVTDGTDGKIKYTTIAGDLDLPGSWALQAKLVLSAGSWHSDGALFQVYDNIDD